MLRLEPEKRKGCEMNPVVERYVRELLERVDPALARGEASGVLAELAQLEKEAGARAAERAGRWQDAVIEKLIPEGASVLDLGCGGGQLLARLVARKHVRGQGIEVDSAAVFESVERGVPVLMSDLDTGLRGFAEQSFDYVVLEETLQTLRRPVEVLAEMLRVGTTGIVSFPNFGYWRVRLDLALRGRMPKSGALPYEWHDTPNIHLLTLGDFVAWAEGHGVEVREGYVLVEGEVREMREGDAVYAEEVLLVVGNGGGSR